MDNIKVSPAVTNRLKCKKISFFLNGREQHLVIPPGMTLLDMLHQKLSLFGTKSTCNEGDCGACTVIIGSRKNDRIVYQAVNSCIYPAVRIHNKHLITIEGIGKPDDLHPVQKALLDFHGTQCGYCTPGFVMAILSLFLDNPEPGREEIFSALEGNLCRCTGYDAIFQATLYLKENLQKGVPLLPPSLQNLENTGSLPDRPGDVDEDNRELHKTLGYLQPKTVEELLKILNDFEESSEYALLNGATDLLVQANVNRIFHPWLIDITAIPELNYIGLEGNNIRIGATTTLTEIVKSPLIARHLPLMLKTISLIASEQIRNLATITGNIGNASPVADTPPVLLVLGAELELASAGGRRTIKLSDYYLDYKKTVLQRGEFISSVIIPLPEEGLIFQDMKKEAKRRAVDISTVNSAFSLRVENGRIKNFRLAFGGVAVYPALASKTMAFIEGKEPDRSWFEETARIAAEEFKPISDVRGRDEYRKTLIYNHTMSYLNDFYESYLKTEQQT